MRIWNTGETDNPDPFATWVDNLAQAFVRLESETSGEGPFAAAIEQADGGPILISRVSATPNWVHRRRKHIGQANDDVVFVNLQTFGAGLTRQHGRDVRTVPFDIAIADTLHPFDIGHAGRFSLYSITVPRRLMPADLLAQGRLPLSKSDIGRDLARMIANYAALALDPRAHPQANRVFGGHIVDLLQIAVTEMRGADANIGRVRVDFDLITDFIRQNSRDPCLSAAAVARAFAVSERHVHKLFAQSGQKFSDYVCVLRLEHCALALGQAAGRSRSIAEIAFEAGFSDLSYFNRRFKAWFGATPSTYRHDKHR
jgi:AraC family transcriptional activator of tynA and feaB